METKKITSLLAIGQLALDLHAANNEVNHAKYKYYKRIEKFERDVRSLGAGRIDKYDEANEDFLAFTKVKYDAFIAAKRTTYNIKRRLGNACRRSA